MTETAGTSSGTPAEREYAVLLWGDERPWAEAGPEERAAVFAAHGRFSEACEAAGHTITGGAELALSGTARTVRQGTDGAPYITDGPYTETVEQLGGYYVVRTADPDGLARLAAEHLGVDGGIEVREQYTEEQGS